jgi:hypothetical protein
MEDSNDVLCDLIDSLDNFSVEDRKLLEKDDLSDKEVDSLPPEGGSSNLRLEAD